MAIVTIDDAKLTSIADAIRAKTGGTTPLTLDQMPGEIEGIQGGEGIVPVSLEIVTPLAQTKYFSGQSFDISGLTLRVTYSNGLIQTVQPTFTQPEVGYTFLPEDATDSFVVTIGYSEIGVTLMVNASISIVDTSSVGVSIVSFANGTDAEIEAMCIAAQQGKINLGDYWSVGDERDVEIAAITGESNTIQTTTISAQKNKLVLVHLDDDGHFFVHTKYAPYQSIKWGINTALNYNESLIRTWLLNKYWIALPDWIKNSAMTVHLPVGDFNNQSTLIYVDDKIFLPSNKNIFGRKGSDIQAEFDADIHWDYYDSADARKKYRLSTNGQTVSTQAFSYWSRSRYYNTINSNYVCLVSNTGGAADGDYSGSRGLAPAFKI